LTVNVVESGQARRDLHLHVDCAGLNTLEGHRGYALDHAVGLFITLNLDC